MLWACFKCITHAKELTSESFFCDCRKDESAFVNLLPVFKIKVGTSVSKYSPAAIETRRSSLPPAIILMQGQEGRSTREGGNSKSIFHIQCGTEVHHCIFFTKTIFSNFTLRMFSIQHIK